MDRRQFLSWVGVGALANSLPVVLVACNPTTKEEPKAESPASPSPSTTASTAGGFAAIATTAALDKDGYVLDKSKAEQPILVLRDRDTKTITAVDAKCTHKGCIVNANMSKKVLVCPCHNSEFAFDGKVLKGPADSPLPTFETKQEKDTILVKTA
ncbi:ubiquinol-cytochrome c reductase iron-sulfur subunit [Oscillatoria sp. FACHB-1406]|uniref:QcrA and Rieske domain-containing protein n=1 Tax=Oscillatoria sp. FACHB-1406 TaxID=2692846 RepID=UPI00168774DF|nr:ubiquinol-cytochrome c reductase iron-sulfur subunit [Oscillatoria sp. FACHB-1406]MBD2577744.1 ubiquinol-cytochrome c reductase iron-sulfur subunit [Oscillatoria sp. FACHB-1406]